MKKKRNTAHSIKQTMIPIVIDGRAYQCISILYNKYNSYGCTIFIPIIIIILKRNKWIYNILQQQSILLI